MTKLRVALISLALSLAFSCFILPLLVPPFVGTRIEELLEVLLWQVMGMVGWPLALLGVVLSLLVGGSSLQLGSTWPLFLYPGMLLLSVAMFLSKRFGGWTLILLHTTILISFIVLWTQVRSGYDFMIG